MLRYFTSDQHFFDSDIITYSDRPYESVEEMNEDMIARFLAKAGDADEVYVLGDIFGSCPPRSPFAACKSVMERLGVHERPFHLVLGNHDHLEPKEYLEIGFESVKTISFTTIGGMNVMLAHDPCMVQPRDTLAICGHIHTLFAENWQPERNTFTINASVEVRNYEPIAEAEILEIVNRSMYRRQG
ncbi:MAG: metallophosphoesterase family protein [Synergistaceae bacterium]|jgi:calcineurin-like phosphoesterase family protein|nr:metallophosphoesterase family protein [Synergistaceae bacterium]